MNEVRCSSFLFVFIKTKINLYNYYIVGLIIVCRENHHLSGEVGALACFQQENFTWLCMDW